MNYRNFQERKRFERFLYSWWSIIPILLIFSISVSGLMKLWAKDRALKEEILVLRGKISEARAEREAGERKLSSLNSPEGIDAEARGKFNLKKDGEEMVIFIDTGESVRRAEGGFWGSEKIFKGKIWQRMKNWIGL